MSDQFLLLLAVTSLFNLAILSYLWASRPRHIDLDHSAQRMIDHTKEMLLIDIRRREQLLEIRLKRLERLSSIR